MQQGVRDNSSSIAQFVWTLTSAIAHSDKSCWPMVAYTFSDGPFKDLIVRLGYDPRKDREARLCVFFSAHLGAADPDRSRRRSYQHIILRNVANVRQRAQPNTRSTAQANAARSRVNRDTPTADDSPAATGCVVVVGIRQLRFRQANKHSTAATPTSLTSLTASTSAARWRTTSCATSATRSSRA